MGVARAVPDAPGWPELSAGPAMDLDLRRDERAHVRRRRGRTPCGVVPVARRSSAPRRGVRTVDDRVPVRLVDDDDRTVRRPVDLRDRATTVAALTRCCHQADHRGGRRDRTDGARRVPDRPLGHRGRVARSTASPSCRSSAVDPASGDDRGTRRLGGHRCGAERSHGRPDRPTRCTDRRPLRAACPSVTATVPRWASTCARLRSTSAP